MSERPGVRGDFRGRVDTAVKFPREDGYDEGQGGGRARPIGLRKSLR